MTQSIHEKLYHLRPSNIKRNPYNVVIIGEIIICTCFQASINSRIQKFVRAPLRICPFDGQIQGEVVVGTTNGENLGVSSYLCPLITIGLTSTWFIWYIWRYENKFLSYTWVPPYIIFSMKNIPTIHKYHRSLTNILHWSMNGASFSETNCFILNCFGYYLGPSLVLFLSNIQCVFLTSPFTRHWFTSKEHVHYPSEVSMVPCKHFLHFQWACLVPQCNCIHFPLLLEIFVIYLHPYIYLCVCV